jgi:hypothetical protein
MRHPPNTQPTSRRLHSPPFFPLLALGLCLLNSRLVAQSRFDYSTVRGRLPVAALTGRHEGESDLELLGKSRIQIMRPYGGQWSGDAHLLWDGIVGEAMHSSFDVESAGLYDILLRCTVAPDYGIFEITLDRTDVRQSIDLYGSQVDLAPLLKLSDVQLPAGPCTIRFKLMGAHPQAQKFQGNKYLMGLDFLELARKDLPRVDAPLKISVIPAQGIAAPGTVRKSNPPDPVPSFSAAEFTATLKQFCLKCHGEESVEAELDLNLFTTRDSLMSRIDTTRQLREVIARREMPPEDQPQLMDRVRQRMLATLDGVIQDYLKEHRSRSPVVMRRLNRYEYNNAVRDLLKLRGDIYPLPEKTIRSDHRYFNPATGRFPKSLAVSNRTLGKEQIENPILTGVSPFAIDLQADGGFNNRGSQLSLSPILLESFLTLGRSILESPEFDDYCQIQETFFSVADESTSEQQQAIARQRLGSFLEVAFRSPVEEGVLNRYHDFFIARRQQTGSFSQSLKEVIAAVLASPRFLYLCELAAEGPESQLSSYELATRLSFFLWSSLPDETLLATARDGSLLQRNVLDAQTRRMLADPRSQALSQNFARQWLRLDQLVTAVPDFDRFPQYYSRIGCEQWKFGLQMMIEPLLLFESILVEDRSIMLLIDCNYSYRSDELQAWYGDVLPFADRPNRDRFNTFQQQYRKRSLQDRRQGGVLTSAATLTMTSSPLRTNPIARGAWVATVIFNRPPPPPPDVVPPIEADDKAIEAQGLTLRERLKQHQSNPACASCHAKIDPLGFALENFDAIGRWRDRYGSGLEIDASGELFGTMPFRNVIELKDQLLDHPEFFQRAFSEHLLSYALGRGLELEDAPAVDEILQNVATDHGQFSTVVRSIVASTPFRYQSRSPSPPPIPDEVKTKP